MAEKTMVKSPVFFQGCTSASGFYSCFKDIYNPELPERLFILKGGPGCGKSTLMRRLAAAADEKGEKSEFGICSSDPDSLDCVTFPGLECSLCDGTAPHIMEPVYPGISETLIALGNCFDEKKLKSNAAEIIGLCRVNSQLHKKAGRYIAAAGSLFDDSFFIACDATDSNAVNEYSVKFAMSIIPEHKEKRCAGTVKRHLLSAVTPKGHIFLNNTLSVMCDRVYTIEDEYGSASDEIIKAVSARASECGYDIYICPCSVLPERKIDHVIIPELKTAVCTSNRYLRPVNTAGRVTHAKRFIDMAKLKKHRQRLSFNRRAAGELLDGAVKCLSDAKAVHDEIEKYYSDAVDFSAVEEMGEKIKKEIFGT